MAGCPSTLGQNTVAAGMFGREGSSLFGDQEADGEEGTGGPGTTFKDTAFCLQLGPSVAPAGE